MKKITKFAFMAVSASMLFVSCQNDEMISAGIADSQRPIEVNPVTGFDGTRSAIYGTTMPIDRNLVISAVYNYETNRGVKGPEDSKNYFQGVTFAYNASKKTWSSEDNPVYWPLTGNLDFLAYSTEDTGIHPTWGSSKWTEGVSLSGFDAGKFISDDLLYGGSSESSPSTTAVPITFHHAKALIVFTAKASFDEAIEIKKIELLEVQPIKSETTVTLPNPNDAMAAPTWADLDNTNLEDVSLPGVADTNRYVVPRTMIDVKKKSGFLGIGGEGIMLAPQTMTSIKVTFAQQYKGVDGQADGQEIEETFTYDCKLGLAEANTKWEAGKRYIYELDFRVNEINVTATVEPWHDAFDKDIPYVIDLPEVATYTNNSSTDQPIDVTLEENTKFIFDNGADGEDHQVEVFTNNYLNAPEGTEGATANITLKAGMTAKFYVSENGKVTLPNDFLFDGKVFDTDKFDVYYEVKFEVGEETTAPNSIGVKFDQLITESSITGLTPPEGKVLDGWYKNEDCTEGYEWNFATDKVTKALTLYAKWSTTPTPPAEP